MPRKAAPKRKEPETTKDEEPKVEEETKKEEPAKKPRRGKNAKNDVKEEEKKEEPKKEEPKEEAKPKAQRGKRGAAAKKEEPKEEEKDDSEEKEEKEEPKPKRGKKAAPKKGEKKEEEKKEEKTEEKPKEEEKKAPSPKKGGRRGAKAAANKKEEPKEEEKKEEEKKEEEKKEDEKEEEKPKKGGKRGAKAAKKEEKEEAEPASKKPKRAAASKKKAEVDDEDEGEGEEGAEGSTAATSGETDFTTPKKKDDELKIISWNIAGWKAILGKGFKEYVKSEDPDVICIQETKVAANTVKEDFLPGYYAHFNGCTKQPGYAGTGMFSKVKPIAWTDGIGIADHDEEGRVITAEFDKFYLVNTYIPNSGRGLKDLDYRKKWDKDFLEYLKKLDAKKPVIWTGDLNVAHEEIDLKNPKTNKNKTAGFSDAEREGFSAVLKAGFVDALRKLYPKQEGFYTFWTYMGNARGKDIGWRLDYFVVSQRAIDKMSDTYRRPLIMGSDHCPIGIHIALK